MQVGRILHGLQQNQAKHTPASPHPQMPIDLPIPFIVLENPAPMAFLPASWLAVALACLRLRNEQAGQRRVSQRQQARWTGPVLTRPPCCARAGRPTRIGCPGVAAARRALAWSRRPNCCPTPTSFALAPRPAFGSARQLMNRCPTSGTTGPSLHTLHRQPTETRRQPSK